MLLRLIVKVLGTGTNSEGAAETTYEVKVEMVDGTELGGDGATYAQTGVFVFELSRTIFCASAHPSCSP